MRRWRPSRRRTPLVAGIFAQVGEGVGALGSPAVVGSDPYNRVMIDEPIVYLEKAEESLAGAESEFASGRYNNCANRAHYACFQAAVAALIRAEIRPAGGRGRWDHAFVQSRFAGQLVNRRNLYPRALRDSLVEAFAGCRQGDYEPDHVSERQAAPSLGQARAIVSAVAARGDHRP